MTDTATLQLRIAHYADLPQLGEVDEHWRDDDRRLRVEQAVLELRCWIAADPGAGPVGYGILRQDWFGHPLVELLIIHPEHRERGIGAALLRRLIDAGGPGAKLFATTNQRNTSMQHLLASEGFIPSGIIHNLDEGDPELVFVKLPT